MRTILGPCPCRACGEPVSWVGTAWVGADGWVHSCVRLWAERCMTASERATWRAENRRLPIAERAQRPCEDCPVNYSLTMRAQGLCNGIPGKVERPTVPEPLRGRGNPYATDEERQAARRASWRDSKRRARMRETAA